MRQDLKRRLAQAETTASAISWVDREAAHRRQSSRTLVKLCDLIRERLRLMGIDPTLAVALRRGEEAAAQLAAIPDTPQLEAADAAIVRSEHRNGGDGGCQFLERIERMAARMRDEQRKLDLANASPAELLAFCVAVEMAGWDKLSG